MPTQNIQINTFIGGDIAAQISEVADFRIKYFRDFPYLYVGSIEYESHYLKMYSTDPRAILITIANSEKKIIAVSTGIPLITSSTILTEAPKLFLENNLDPKDYYYYGEVIISHDQRGKGLVKPIYEIQEKFASTLGFKAISISTVVRAQSDKRRPSNYIETDPIWTKLGFSNTGINFEFNWPTIGLDGSISEQLNPMTYWIKKLN